MSEEQVTTTPTDAVAEPTTQETPVAETSTAPVAETAEVKDPVVEKAEEVARKLKLKVDGIEQELPEEEVIKLAQMSKAAQKRFNEAAKMKKDSARFIEMLKENPLEVLNHPDIGVDVKKFAEDYLLKELEKQEMSPEAKAKYEAEQELAAIKKEAEELKSAAEKEKQAKLQQQYTVEYEQQIQTALEKTSIPKTPHSVQRMATYMMAALENGVDLHPEQAAQLVKQDYMGDVMSLFGSSDGETLLSILGEEVAGKIRKTDLARLEAQLAPKVTEEQGEAAVSETLPLTSKEEADSHKPMNNQQWRDYMEKLRQS